MVPIFIYLATCIFSALAFPQSSESVRATWIDRSQFDFCRENETCKELAMDQLLYNLSYFKLTRVYIDTWNYGKVFFNSSFMRSTVGESGIGSQLIPWAVKYAKKYHMEVYAWFQYGMMAGGKGIPFEVYARSQNWVLGEKDGMVFLDPRTGASEFLGKLMAECVNTGIDGLQLDDNFACYTEMSKICTTSVMTSASSRVVKIIRSKSSKIPISLSPLPMPYSADQRAQDWPIMMKMGLFGEVVPQYYCDNYDWCNKLMDLNEKYLDSNMRAGMIYGISLYGDVKVPWYIVENSLKRARNAKYGVCIWYAKRLLEVYPKEMCEFWKCQG